MLSAIIALIRKASQRTLGPSYSLFLASSHPASLVSEIISEGEDNQHLVVLPFTYTIEQYIPMKGTLLCQRSFSMYYS